MFTNVDVYFPVKYAEPEVEDGNFTWNFFIGFEVDDEKYGTIGTIVDVDTTTINTLLVIEGLEEEEILIPAQESFIVGVDTDERVLVVNLPEGLLDMENAESEDC